MTTPLEERFSCSTAARSRGDDATGTVARIDAWILVEYPQTWGRDPIRDAALPPPVKQSLLRALKEIPRSRLLFIRRRAETEQRCRVYVARSSGRAGYSSIDLPSIDEVAVLPFPSLLEEASVDSPPLVLVCTHGQHDSCCGRRGYPLYDVLRSRAGIDTWQCSHVGGDRFAANAVVLPWGLFYGPVEPYQADALLASIAADEIFLPAYRGSSTVLRPAQAAETFVRRAASILGREGLVVIDAKHITEKRVVVHLREGADRLHTVTVEQYVSTAAAFATCGSRQSAPIEQFRLVEHLVAEQIVPPG